MVANVGARRTVRNYWDRKRQKYLEPGRFGGCDEKENYGYNLKV